MKPSQHKIFHQIRHSLYLSNMVFENDILQYLSHEEGRIRPVRDVNNNITSFTYDYFLKDHLGNVRMVLTEEQKQDMYPPASMETAQASVEEALYDNISETRVSKPAGYPTDNYTNPNDKVAKVDGNGNKIGPSIILKVMAGDSYNLRASSWYKTGGASPASPNSMAIDLIASFFSSLAGIPGYTHGSAALAELQNSGVVPTALNSFLGNQPAPGSTKPKAYLNWVLLDEQFKFVEGSSGAEQVGSDNTFKVHTKANLSVTKNGYLYVFVSNETPNINVYFDNLQITHDRGAILEETHYYPFGLTMAGISSKALQFGSPENKYKWNKGSELQNKEFSDGSGLEWYATPLRSLDPQLGRWWQIDSKPDYGQSLYSSMQNNPILYNDPLGDTIVVQDAKMQKQIMKDFGKVYGKKSGYFQFNSNGVLGFTEKGTKALAGSVVANVLSWGSNQKISALSNSLVGAAKVMNSTEMTSIVYSNNKVNRTAIHAATGQTVSGVRPTDTGGEFTLTKTDNPSGYSVGGRNFDNVIFVNPKSSTTSTIGAAQLYNPSQQLLIQAALQGGVQVINQRHSLLMHGLGHVIYQSPTDQPSVIRYDNYNRILSGAPTNQDLDGSHR